MLMKSTKTFTTDLYEAPACVVVACPDECLCAESVGSTTEDYNDGGNFTW